MVQLSGTVCQTSRTLRRFLVGETLRCLEGILNLTIFVGKTEIFMNKRHFVVRIYDTLWKVVLIVSHFAATLLKIIVIW